MSGTYRGDDRFVSLLERCREMRQEATSAEQVLWSVLRGRQIVGAKFRRQHQFGPYILDFYCADCRLVVEADGGQHSLPDVAAYDANRTA